MLTIENDILIKCDENATEVVIPDSVKRIEDKAFDGCKSDRPNFFALFGESEQKRIFAIVNNINQNARVAA